MFNSFLIKYSKQQVLVFNKASTSQKFYYSYKASQIAITHKIASIHLVPSPSYKYFEDIQMKCCQQITVGKIICVWEAKILNKIIKLLVLILFYQMKICIFVSYKFFSMSTCLDYPDDIGFDVGHRNFISSLCLQI